MTDSDRAGEQSAVPSALRQILLALAVLIVLMIALPVAMAVDRDATGESIMRNNPSLDPSDRDFAINAAIAYAAVVHAIYAAVAVWLAVKCTRGRRWARIALTVVMVIATLGSLVSAAAGPEYYWAVIPSDIIHLTIIGLLWLPKPVRSFFTAHRSRAG